MYKSLIFAVSLLLTTPAFAADFSTAEKLIWSGKATEAIEVLKESPDLIKATEPGNKFTLLHLASMVGNYEAAKYLIAHGADVNAKDAEGYTPLVRADANRQTKIVELLKAHGGKE